MRQKVGVLITLIASLAFTGKIIAQLVLGPCEEADPSSVSGFREICNVVEPAGTVLLGDPQDVVTVPTPNGNQYRVINHTDKRLFVPFKIQEEWLSFKDATKASGEAPESTRNITALGALTTFPTDKQLHHSTSSPGVEICELDPASGYADCMHICGEDLTDARNGKTYGTVEIGGKCWFTEDLEYSELDAATESELTIGADLDYLYAGDTPDPTWPTGGNFPNIADDCNVATGFNLGHFNILGWDRGSAGIEPAYQVECVPSGSGTPILLSYMHGVDQTNYTIEGKYYVSGQVTDDSCPVGWHVPTDEEWRELETNLGVTNVNTWGVDTWNGNPVDGIIIQQGSGNPQYREVPTANTLLTTMGWNTGNHLYWLRDRTTSTGISGADAGPTYSEHIIRNISSGGGNTSFVRSTERDESIIHMVKHAPMPTWLAWLSSFFPTAEAVLLPQTNGKIRCVKGAAAVHYHPGPWSACQWVCPYNCGPATSDGFGGMTCTGGTPMSCGGVTPFYRKVRDLTCRIGNYQVHLDHCSNNPNLSLVNTTATCPVPAPNSGPSS